MKNKVYYGEYTLRHWIELILKKNIILPPYQRNFVWKETKVRKLISTLQNEEFIPPITIGLFKTNAETQNLILDGQQRLTSILLSYLNIMPDADKFKAKKIELASLSEGDEPEEYENNFDNILDWNFNSLIKKGSDKDSIITQLHPDNYKSLELTLQPSFFEDRYLGFSYIVPQDDNSTHQQKFYSSVFRNINIQGEPLLAQESREALYYFNTTMPTFFKPAFCDDIKLKPASSYFEVPLDFVRYMSLLSQYHVDHSTSHLARGYRSNMERYYERYIYAVLKEEDNITYGDFATIFPNNEYTSRLDNLSQTIDRFNLTEKSPFTSIIDMDTYLFGLIYQVVFQNKQLDEARMDDLKIDLERKINDYKRDTYHQRTPNAFKYMRPRVADSINLYSRYVVAE